MNKQTAKKWTKNTYKSGQKMEREEMDKTQANLVNTHWTKSGYNG